MSGHGQVLHLASADDVEALLDDLATAMAPSIGPDTVLVGILRRGAPLAHRLAQRLNRAGTASGVDTSPRSTEVGELALKRYSDELEVLHRRPYLDAMSLKIDVVDRHVILVDDVLYTGESLFRAACHLREAGATRIQAVVLCARGMPDMPIRADFVGRHLDVGPGWIVDCSVPPFDDTLGITIRAVAASRP